MELINQCLISGCPNEATLIAKSGGKSYYSCKEHKKSVAQIVASEHSRSEVERARIAADSLYSEDNKEVPKWIGF